MSDLKKLLALVGATVLVRCLLAASVPMLAGEAYYWLWGHHLAAGYFDHPPMVGWMSHLFFGGVLGSELVARSGPIVLGAFTIVALYYFVRDLFGDSRLALRAAALFSIAPIFISLGFSVQPDNSLLLFCTLNWWFFWRAARAPGGLLWWILAGVAAGLALLSKFHAWVLLPPLWAFLLISPQRRPLLKTAGPWLAALVALIVLSPNLIWNAQHEWLNYAYQLRRSDLPESTFEIKNIGIFIVGALISLSPLVCIAVLGAIVKALKKWRTDDRLLFLLCAGLPLPAFLGLLSFVVTISFHWPSCGYIPLMILSLALIGRGELSTPRFARAMWIVCIAMAALACLTPFALKFITPAPPDADSKYAFASLGRLKQKMTGWPEIGDKVRTLHAEMNAEAPTVIMGKNWHTTSMLAFYGRLPTECFALDAADAHNYELWRQARGGLQGTNAVVVIEKTKPNYKHSRLRKKYDKYHRYLDPLFEKVEPAPSLVFYPDGSMEEVYGIAIPRPRLREFLIFKAYGFKGKLSE